MSVSCPTCGQSIADIEGLHFDPDANVIVGNGQVAILTSKEMELVLVLKDRFPRLVTKEALMEAIYLHESDTPETMQIIDVFVCKIRDKIKGTGFDIGTVWGKGYRMMPLEEKTG